MFRLPSRSAFLPHHVHIGSCGHLLRSSQPNPLCESRLGQYCLPYVTSTSEREGCPRTHPASLTEILTTPPLSCFRPCIHRGRPVPRGHWSGRLDWRPSSIRMRLYMGQRIRPPGRRGSMVSNCPSLQRAALRTRSAFVSFARASCALRLSQLAGP